MSDETRKPDEVQKGFSLRGSIRTWAELTGIWALVVAYPVLENVASGPEAVTRVGAGRLDLMLLVLFVVFVPPMVAWAVEIALRVWVSFRIGDLFHAGCLGAAAAIFVWQQVYERTPSPAVKALLLVGVLAAVALLWLRSEFMRNFASILSVATPVVVVVFIASYPILDEVSPHESKPEVERVDADTPVVLMVFDELPLTSITSEPGKINGRMFPGFKELSESSTWYPNTVTNSSGTLSAVPTLMTGEVHPSVLEPEPPGEARTPNNLCTILGRGGYALHAHESISSYCGTPYSVPSRLVGMLERSPEGPVLPGGILEKTMRWLEARVEPIRGWRERAEALDAFIEDLPSTERQFSFIHSTLPHTPWEYLPDGRRYFIPLDQGFDGAVWGPSPFQLRANLQRHLLQVGLVDRAITRTIKNLKERGLWEKAMVVVTADHGVHLEPGGHYRTISRKSAGTSGVIPLFVKYPGQATGRISWRVARSSEVAPTILEELGLKVPAGRTTLNSPDLGEDPLTIGDVSGDLQISRAQIWKERRRMQRLRNRALAGGSFFAVANHDDLLGESVSKVGARLSSPLAFNPGTTWQQSSMAPTDMSASSIDGTFESPKLRDGDPVAVLLDDVVVATTPVWLNAAQDWYTSVVLPSMTPDDLNRVSFRRVRRP